ncbi:hypothetical protein [Cellulosimicrobium cellulans]|nr:hypothetical protein [Cellulosimicrobium cellulans]
MSSSTPEGPWVVGLDVGGRGAASSPAACPPRHGPVRVRTTSR